MAAATDLKTPLIPSSELILNVDDQQTNQETPANECSIFINSHLDLDQIQNAYEFIGSNGFELPWSTTLDPFRNQTPKIEGVYEWIKVLVCAPIALLRLVLFGLCLLIGYVATKSDLNGWKDKQNPMPKWRCRIMWIIQLCTRGILFSFGFHWNNRKEKPAPREIAPILVSNHVICVNRFSHQSRKHAVNEIKFAA